MSNFIVRIELHGATSEAIYAMLHTAMEKAGFSRRIVSDAGASYLLPSAMYVMSSAGNAVSVHQTAATAVASTGYTATIFVAQMSAWWSSGLVAAQHRGLVSAR